MLRLYFLLAVCVVSGCEPDDVGLRWELDLDAETRSRAVRVEAWIAHGSCAELGEEIRRVELGAGGTGLGEVVLEPGAYAFGARAADVDCRWFAAGCEDAQLPLDDGASVVVPVVASGAELDVCPVGVACADGSCVADAGVPDGGADAGVDAGPAGPCGQEHADVETLPVCRASGAVSVDGVFDEYEDAAPVVVTAGEATVTFRALWDCEHLYLAGDVMDAQVWATYTAHDSEDLWRTDSVEVMLDSLHDATTSDTDENDFHLLVGATGTVRDAQGGTLPYDATYEMEGLMVRTAVQGTVDDEVADTGWVLEIAIAWADLGIEACPEPGAVVGADLALNDETRSGGEIMHDLGDWAGLSIYANPAAWNDLLLLDSDGQP